MMKTYYGNVRSFNKASSDDPNSENDYEDVTVNQDIRNTSGPSPRPGRRVCIWVAVGLAVVCVLQLILNVYLCIRAYSTSGEDLMKITRYDDLQNSYTNLTKERDQLQTSYNTLINQTCPQGWIKYGLSCYYISSHKKTWAASRQDCLDRGANLVIINSREEQAYIKSLNQKAWIGLNDRDVDGTWRWVVGNPLTTRYWNQGEPNGGTQENCVENKNMVDDLVFAWNDAPCDILNNFICERELKA
ncbi:hypothetical protein DPEC_G00296810 [Dallia pectoralis]|uniref:Uncharacterized protein n=1 Tax=Dallia pectoralis TaxID=75939 RepID=A0ACC2FFH8_DALPE|nr:hypothetical protein DPEC_G00296810 [Dallia pectoralis]